MPTPEAKSLLNLVLNNWYVLASAPLSYPVGVFVSSKPVATFTPEVKRKNAVLIFWYIN